LRSETSFPKTSPLRRMAKGKKRKLNAPPRSMKKEQHGAKLGKATTGRPRPEPTIPFQAEDRILLVGEGDFSFAKSIVEHHACYQVVATCFDLKEQLFEKYNQQAKEHVQYLEDEGQTVLYGIDATKLDKAKSLRSAESQYDVALFNFPHVGGKSKDVNRQVRFNQELLVSFFKAAIPVLSEHGTIVVTLFEGEPYTLWNIRDLARHSGLEVQRSFKFVAEAYPGYSHARTLGNINGGGGWKGEDRDARSYIFQKKNGAAKPGVKAGEKRKRKRDDGSDEDG
jgi:25S rRNA (uracil2634-N3)-methyltransferase